MRATVGLVAIVAGTTAARAQQPSATSMVLVPARAGSIQVVGIPVPSALANAGDIVAHLQLSRGFALLGDSVRTLRAGSADLLLTMTIAASVRAGRTRAVVARFGAADGRTAVSDVDADIAWRRGLKVSPEERRLGAVRGDRFTLAYRVSNTGNARDSVQLRLELPYEWRASEAQGSVALDPGAVADRTARIAISPQAPTGASVVRVLAIAGNDTVAAGEAMIEVNDADRRTVADGATLRLASLAAATPNGIGGAGQALTIDGPVSDHIKINGQAALAPIMSSQPFALSRMGYAARTPSLTLTGDAWRLQLGAASLTLPELAGVMVAGTGAAFEQGAASWRLRSIVARADGGMGGPSSGELVAASGSRQLTDSGSVTVTASHLVDDRFGVNRLDALATELRTPVGFGATMINQLAERRYDAAGGEAAGIGWQTEIRRDGPTGMLMVRASNAPGGSAAFARAKQRVDAQLSQRVGRAVSLAADFWHSRDSSAAWRSLDVQGWSFRPSVRIAQALDLGLDARQSSYVAQGTTGTLGTGETALGVTADVRRGTMYANGTLSAGSERRDAAAGAVQFDNSVSHATARAAFGLSTLVGNVEGTLTGDRTGEGAGLPPRQIVYGLQLTDVRLLPWSRLLTAEVHAQRFDWFGDRAAVHSLDTKLDINLPRSVKVSLEATHDPFLSILSTPSHWIYGVRVETAVLLPRHRTASDEGLVFRDVNGNGRQDPGEPGIAGVMVRRGSETTVTGSDGHFAFQAPGEGSVEVDTRSLPPGLVAPPGDAGARPHARQIGLISVVSARVRLTLGGEDRDRVSPEDMARVAVIARDTAGHPWVARSTAPDIRVFDALPPGRYAIEIDASAASEPLRTLGELPTIEISGGLQPPESTIMLRGRSLKIRQMPKDTP